MKSKLEFTAYPTISPSSSQSWIVNKYGISFSVKKVSTNENSTLPWLQHTDEFIIYDIKGDFDITGITYGNQEAIYDKENKSFSISSHNSSSSFTSLAFSICANIEYEDNDSISKLINVNHSLWIPSDLLMALGSYTYKESSFTLRGYDYLFFKFFIKKVDDSYIEVHVENLYDIKICGKKGDYIYILNNTQSRTIDLSFVFDPTKFNKEMNNQNSEAVSRPISTSPKPKTPKPSWYEIMANSKYFDVILLSSDNVEIKTHRCILGKFSKGFAKIIEESEAHQLPSKINIDEFDAETIQVSLDFLYDKIDSINGKETNVFKFASACGIDILKDNCCAHFENAINTKNVCEYIKIAYENGFEELKQKCKEFIVTNKKNINSAKLKELPKDIIVDIFCN